ncbi:MAG: hypothetical protein ACM3YM_02670 [Sphingomonadales bacterium]
MANTSDIDLVDKLARKRAHMATALAAAFIAVQATDISNRRADGHFDIPFALWTALLLVILLYGGGMFRSAKVRDALNDETTRAHRRAAMACGFIVTLGSAFIVYVLSFFDEVTTRQAVRLIITVAVAGTLLRFAGLERRALRQ